MTDESFEYAGAHGARIHAYRWAPPRPRAVLQVAHGMGEHALRYRAPLAPLIDAGIAIYANDHRGHGRTARTPEALGDFGPGGADAVIEDMARLTRRARHDHPGLPILFLGHSMGSFLGQSYLLHHASLLAGAALSGSAALDHLAASGAGGSGLEAFNARFEPARTPFDWLSRDPREVDAYIDDPLCGFTINEGSMLSLFAHVATLADPNELKALPPQFPIYVLAGLDDPVNNGGAWLTPLIERYKAAGCAVSADLYEGARHEVLNETNRAEVVAKLTDWVERVIAAHA